jgi:hypothetical protein
MTQIPGNRSTGLCGVSGYVCHALSRASTRATIFDGPIDYQRFEQVLGEARGRTVTLHACAMPSSFVEKIPLLC